MRIADKMNYDQVTTNLGRNRSEMSELQNQAALQKKVTKPSDDPLGATRVLTARTEVNTNNQFLKSIANARAFLEYSEQSLGELSDVLIRAKELAIAQANDASAGPKSRELVAAEVNQLHSQSVQIGNRKFADRFLFGGFRTTKPPFDPTGKYYGDNGMMEVTIDKDAKVAMNMPGSFIFLGRQVIDASDASEQSPNLLVPKAKPPAPLKQNSDIQDSELPAIRTPASEKQVPPSETKTETAHQEAVSKAVADEGINLFRVLKELEVGLRTNDKPQIQESLNQIDQAIEQVVLARSQLGARVGTMNAALESIQKGTIDAKTLASNIEDADTFQLVSDINKTESALKATLATSGKLIQPSLLDFLR